MIIRTTIQSTLGCQHRAHLFSKYLTKHLKKKFPRKKFDLPKKHFIFGDLAYETDNVRRGNVVSWGFHVVPILKLSANENLYILDPSISPDPLTKSEYHYIFRGRISGYVTCDSNTYNIGDDCFAPGKVDKIEIKDDERLLDL